MATTLPEPICVVNTLISQRTGIADPADTALRTISLNSANESIRLTVISMSTFSMSTLYGMGELEWEKRH